MEGRNLMGTLMVDFITSLDGYGAAEGWPGWWGMESPEYLGWLGEQPEHTVLMGATTYRLMAEQASDLVARKLGISAGSTTAEEVLPGQASGHHYWLGHRLAEHEATGGGDAALICECEFVTRDMLDQFLADRWPCSLDDVRRGTRLGMGPCQGAFCTFRAAGIIADRIVARSLAPAVVRMVDPPLADEPPAIVAVPASDGPGPVADSSAVAADLAKRALVAFLRERYKGTRPIAYGRQLQELWLATGLYWGVLGIETFGPSAVAIGSGTIDGQG